MSIRLQVKSLEELNRPYKRSRQVQILSGQKERLRINWLANKLKATKRYRKKYAK